MEWVDPPFCSGHWGPELVEIAGGHDPLGRKHQPSAQIEWQQVLDARPDIIVLALCGYDIDRARHDYELLRRFPGFGSIPAADSGQVYVVNASAYFARPGPRIVDSLEILAEFCTRANFPTSFRADLTIPRVVRCSAELIPYYMEYRTEPVEAAVWAAKSENCGRHARHHNVRIPTEDFERSGEAQQSMQRVNGEYGSSHKSA